MYACQPICQLVIDSDQYFVCVAKPQSHVALYTVVAELQHLGHLHRLTHKHWNGRHYEHWTFRFACEVPLRGDVNTLLVNWLEVTVSDAHTCGARWFGGINRAAKANRDESEQRKWADGRDQRRRKQ